MKSRNVTCCSEDGQATVTVARKLGHDFPGVVQWKTENGDAISGVHYEANLGNYSRYCTIRVWYCNSGVKLTFQENSSSGQENLSAPSSFRS